MDLGFFLFTKKLGFKNYFFAKTQRKTPPIVEIKSNEYVSGDWTGVLII
jgi:methyl-accepting chemotaxis protein